MAYFSSRMVLVFPLLVVFLLGCHCFPAFSQDMVDDLFGKFGDQPEVGPIDASPNPRSNTSIKPQKVVRSSNSAASGEGVQASLILLMDISGSMAGEKLRSAKSAAKETIRRAVERGAEVGILAFEGSCSRQNPGSAISRTHPLSTEVESLCSFVDGLADGGGTPLACAVQHANRYLKENQAQSSRSQMIILLADGQDDCGHLDSVLAGLRGTETLFRHETIGLGVGDSAEAIGQLKQIAKASGGNFHNSPSTSQLSQAFSDAFQTMAMMEMFGKFGNDQSAIPSEPKGNNQSGNRNPSGNSVSAELTTQTFGLFAYIKYNNNDKDNSLGNSVLTGKHLIISSVYPFRVKIPHDSSLIAGTPPEDQAEIQADALKSALIRTISRGFNPEKRVLDGMLLHDDRCAERSVSADSEELAEKKRSRIINEAVSEGFKPHFIDPTNYP